MLIDSTCTNCGTQFQREKKRGRPHVKCEKCRSGVKGRNVSDNKKPSQETEKPLRKFKDDPTPGNPRYSVSAFVEYMDTYGVPIGAQEVAKAIKEVRYAS